MVHMVSYDLNQPGQNYDDLIGELKNSPGWWHYLKSTWLISTNESAAHLSERVRQHMDDSDRLLVMEVRAPAHGWLSDEAWQWIHERVA